MSSVRKYTSIQSPTFSLDGAAFLVTYTVAEPGVCSWLLVLSTLTVTLSALLGSLEHPGSGRVEGSSAASIGERQ